MSFDATQDTEFSVIPNQFVYQTKEILALESLAKTKFGISESTMMQRAGKAALEILIKNWPQAKEIIIFCGSGNNGGDGYALATLANERGLHVKIFHLGELDNIKPTANEHYQICRAQGIAIKKFAPTIKLGHVDVVVDALCGTGLRKKLRADTVAAITCMESTGAPILSLDVPTGIDADTGNVLGDAVHATATITFIALKLGLLTGSGRAYAGEIFCHDLALPSEIFSLVTPPVQKKELADFKQYLKPRPKDWHKGLAGHVLIVGGECGYAGAPRMAGEAALRVGAGLVSIATKAENAIVMNVDRPELMCHAINRVTDLKALLKKCDMVVIGPGLGQTDWSNDLWHEVLSSNLPLVLDADALNLLSKQHHFNENWVLTPHPGEAARLLNKQTDFIQADRLNALKLIQNKFGGTCVLKGSGTLTLTEGDIPVICDHGNPGMASGGMGDILSGVIGGLIAQSIPAGIAAQLGVLLHAMAGDLAATSGERGTIATDLLPYLRRLSNFA